MLRDGQLPARLGRARAPGWRGRFRAAALPQIAEVRGRGLWIGIDLVPEAGEARAACERLMERGILAKDTHERTIRLAPPLCVSREDLDWALERILDVLSTAGS